MEQILRPYIHHYKPPTPSFLEDALGRIPLADFSNRFLV